MKSRSKKKKSHGGHRRGAGRKDVLSEAVRTYRALETLRLPEDASNDLRALVKECREKMLSIMRKPSRHAQTMLAAAKALLEEACGKATEQINIREHQVTVEIRQNVRPEGAAAAGLPAARATITPVIPPAKREAAE